LHDAPPDSGGFSVSAADSGSRILLAMYPERTL